MGEKKNIFDPTISLGNILLLGTWVLTSGVIYGTMRTELKGMKQKQIELQAEINSAKQEQIVQGKVIERLLVLVERKL